MDLLDSIAWGCHCPYPKLSEYEVIVTSQFKVWTTSPIVQPQYKKGLHEARDSDISHAIEKTSSSAWYDLKGKGKSSNVSFLLSLLSTVATNRKGIAVSFLCNIAACQFKQRLELDWNNPAWLCKVMNVLQCLCCKKISLSTILYFFHISFKYNDTKCTQRDVHISLPEVGENMQHAPTLDYRSMASIEIPRAVQGTTAYIYMCVWYSTLGQVFECVNRQPQPWN